MQVEDEKQHPQGALPGPELLALRHKGPARRPATPIGFGHSIPHSTMCSHNRVPDIVGDKPSPLAEDVGLAMQLSHEVLATCVPLRQLSIQTLEQGPSLPQSLLVRTRRQQRPHRTTDAPGLNSLHAILLMQTHHARRAHMMLLGAI